MNGIISSDLYFAALINLPGGYLGSKSCKAFLNTCHFYALKGMEISSSPGKKKKKKCC
jgi:hypothetical protein